MFWSGMKYIHLEHQAPSQRFIRSMSRAKSSILALAFVPGVVMAGGQEGGKILEMRAGSTTLLGGNPSHFRLDSSTLARVGYPACASNWWALNTDTPAGRSMYAALLFAMATGRAVSVAGSGQCDLRGDMETTIQVNLVQ
jgi:hypothetical protein